MLLWILVYLLLIGFSHAGDLYGQACIPGAVILLDPHRCYCNDRGFVYRCEDLSGELVPDLRKKQPKQHGSGSNKKLQGRIVGGRTISIINHPYMMALEVGGALLCGATIMGSLWAITAAHCMDGLHTAGMKLRADSSLREKGGHLFRVTKIISHKDFDAETYAYDIAVLRVETPFESVQERLVSVDLPDKEYTLPVGTEVSVLGWGDTRENGTLSENLREVIVPIVSPKDCHYVYGEYVTSNMLCAGYPEGNSDACQADSGGPMVHNGTLVGLVSFGEGCGRKNRPGVYTRVAAFREWLKENTGI